MRFTLLVLVMSGCTPFAYVLPPLDVASDVGVRTHAGKLDTVVNLSIGVRPLSLLKELHEREHDFSVGYIAGLTPGPFIQGAYGEYSYVLTRPSDGLRLRAAGQARLLYDKSRKEYGAQGLARLVFELTTFVDSDFEDHSEKGWLAGHAMGEGCLGFYAEVSYLRVATTTGWAVSVGVTGTIPASAGIGFAWLK